MATTTNDRGPSCWYNTQHCSMYIHVHVAHLLYPIVKYPKGLIIKWLLIILTSLISLAASRKYPAFLYNSIARSIWPLSRSSFTAFFNCWVTSLRPCSFDNCIALSHYREGKGGRRGRGRGRREKRERE